VFNGIKNIDRQLQRLTAQSPWLPRAFVVLLMAAALSVFCSIFYFANYHTRKATLLVFLTAAVGDLLIMRYGRTEKHAAWDRGMAAVFLATAIALCALQLLSVWRHGIGNYWCLGGLLPYSDPGGYYHGARSLIELGILDDFSSRRPLAPSFYGLLLWLTNQNLQAALLIAASLVGIAVYFPAIELFRRYGITAGAIMLFALFGHIGEYLNTTLTEPIGYLAGTCAFVFLLRGISDKRRGETLWGLALLGLALSVRSGPMLVPPLIILLAGFVFGASRRFSWSTATAGALVTVFSLSVSVAVIAQVNPGTASNYNGSFAYTLYGLATGKRALTQPKLDHPELNDPGLAEAQRSKAVYRYAFREIRAHPATFFSEILGGYRTAARRAPDWFSPLYPLTRKTACLGLFLVALLSLAFSGKNERRTRRLLLLSVLGMAITLPIMLDGGSRILSAAEPFMCGTIAIGIALLVGRVGAAVRGHGAQESHTNRASNTGLLPFSVAIALLLVGGPFLLKAISRGKNHPAITAAAGQKTAEPDGARILFRASKGTFVHLTGDSSKNWMPEVRISAFKAWAQYKGFKKVVPGQYVGSIFNLLLKNEYAYLVLDQDPSRFAGRYCLVSAKAIVDEECNVYEGKITVVLPAR
jgi:hypothetical protein